ncbi:myosin-1B isoform X1 [Folsomia candida]|uniref:myosin-1B isoform X1 n=1 Tax=Folsomia candida TaxID=158441 RepID=UPI000B90A414|nr:myosin-1B isoform X1 [Folsomia candida]
MESSTNFLQILKSQFGSTEEFGQFERDFYSQKEEVAMLRGNLNVMRSTVVKLHEEKRVLELQLVSEKASREQDSKNYITDLEKNNMQLNTKTYSIKCEVETWKRQAEATKKEAVWLKEQLKTVELEKTEAIRKVEDFARQHNGIEQYRLSIVAYLKRHKDNMTDIQKRIDELEKAKLAYSSLVEQTEKQVKVMAVNLKFREKAQVISESRIKELEQEIIRVKAELVQNNAELLRNRELQAKTEQLVNKLIVENKDLHSGFNVLVSSINDDIRDDVNADIFKRIPLLHDEIMRDVTNLTLHK